MNVTENETKPVETGRQCWLFRVFLLKPKHYYLNPSLVVIHILFQNVELAGAVAGLVWVVIQGCRGTSGSLIRLACSRTNNLHIHYQLVRYTNKI